MLKKDKKLHLIAGAIVAAIVYIASSGSIMLSILAAFVIGLLKEIYDAFHPKKHTVDFWDFAVTGLGGVLFVVALKAVIILL
jgi:hypothetical protein